MKNGHKITIVVVAIFFGYVLGNNLPIDFLKPNLTDDNVTKSDYYKLIISLISAFITFCAVIVALFKDDFRELWKHPKIEFQVPVNITIEDIDSPENAKSESTFIQANRYISRIEVHNKGNLPALNAEIYLEKLEFIPKESTISQHIETPGSALKWNATESISIIIPPGGKKLINVVEITAPENTSLPDSAKTNKPSNLIIGNIINTTEREKGKWKATFSLYAQNLKPISFEIIVEWTGLWKNRLTEFNNQYKISKTA